jgi:Cft2 family RNA processing exonuclease
VYVGLCIAQVFTRGGNVLLPVESSGRLLEVLLVLDQLWQQHK